MTNDPDKRRKWNEPWLPPELNHLWFLAEPPKHDVPDTELAAALRQRIKEFHAHREELERHGCYLPEIVELMEAMAKSLEHDLHPMDDPEEHRLQDIANSADVFRLGLTIHGGIVEREFEREPWNEENREQKEIWDEVKKHLPKEPDREN